MNVKFNSLTPNMMVEDVNQCINFYHSVLGFNTVSKVPEDSNEPVWAMMEKDGINIMFQEEKNLKEDLPELRNEEPGSGAVFFIKMTGIDELFTKILQKADVVDQPKDTFYGMREFTIKDLNGYYLTFAEPIKK